MRKICILIVLLILVSQSFTQTVSVPLSHWAYDAVERWEVRGLADGVFNNSKPFSRTEMAEYIKVVLRKFENQPEHFSRTDRQQLQYLGIEFREELEKLGYETKEKYWVSRTENILSRRPFSILASKIFKNHRDLLFIHHGEFNMYANVLANVSRQQRINGSGVKHDESITSNGFSFQGNLGKNLGFYFNLTDNHVVDDEVKKMPWVPQVIEESGRAYLSKGSNNNYDFDDNMAYLSFSHEYFYLVYGRDYNSWGVGKNGNLLLSDNAQLYDQIKFVIRYWRFKYTHITAALEYVDPAARWSLKSQPHTDVYWAGNRLELDLGKGVQLGFAEAVVYGDRSLQLGYLTPVSFYKSLEHYYGDRDNGLISFDLEWRIRPGVKLYGEMLIDDMTSSKIGSKFFGNKFGWQTGLFLVNPLGISDVDLLAEYTKIKPYVYSQSWQPYNKYKHYDTILGHYIGPNSEDIFLRMRKRFSKFLSLTLEFEKYRHGANPADRNVGGDPDLAFRYGIDNRDVTFLDGDFFKQKSYGISLQYEFLRNLVGQLDYRIFQFNTNKEETLVNFRFSYNFGQRLERFKNIFPITY